MKSNIAILLSFIVVFIYSCKKDEEKEQPILSSLSIIDVQDTEAVLKGSIVDSGTETIIESGICWCYGEEFVELFVQKYVKTSSTNKEITLTLTGLRGNSAHTACVYAKTGSDTYFGGAVTFTTKGLIPIVTTKEPTDVIRTTAVCGGEIFYDAIEPNYDELSAIVKYGICWNTDGNPLINDSCISNRETNILSFNNTIFNLRPSTEYFIRAYVITATDTVYGNQISIETMDALETSIVNDYEGNTYKTVKIGDQWWMAENLRSIKYADGVSINRGTDLPWVSLDFPSYYFWYNNDSLEHALEYGTLYSWNAAMNLGDDTYLNNGSNSNPSEVQGVCPSGWHLPSLAEYEEMFAYLGGKDQAGKAIKEMQTTWGQEEIKANNRSGFSGLPAGYVDNDGMFDALYWTGQWWTTTSENTFYKKSILINVNIEHVQTPNSHKLYGHSVRCVKD